MYGRRSAVSVREPFWFWGDSGGGVLGYGEDGACCFAVLSDNLEQDVPPHSIGNRFVPDIYAKHKEYKFLLLSCTEETEGLQTELMWNEHQLKMTVGQIEEFDEI